MRYDLSKVYKSGQTPFSWSKRGECKTRIPPPDADHGLDFFDSYQFDIAEGSLCGVGGEVYFWFKCCYASRLTALEWLCFLIFDNFLLHVTPA